MTKHLRLFLTMLVLTLLGSSAAWAGSVDITPSQALNDGGVDPITVTCAKGDGSSNPQISSGQLRLYQAGKGNTTGNTITFSSENTITKIVFTFANNMTADNGVFSEGDYDSSTSTWTGSTNSVTLTVTGTTTGQRIYISAMTVTYEGGGTVIQTVAAPTFSPAGGTFTEAQSVEISTTTDGATIYYTTDGSNPTTSSNVYSSAISVEGTTTIKAIAVKNGMNNSSVAEATYSIISVGGDSWVETSLAELTEDDVFVIVGDNGFTYALSNDNGTGSAPSAVTVTVSDGVLVGTPAANIQWNLSGNASNGYTFYPNGSTSTWLYCTSTNNGVRVGTNDAKTFTIADGYLKHVGTSRYVGIYSSQDWRCYTSINSNIEGQTFKFYKKPTDGPVLANPQLAFSSTTATAIVGGQFTAPTLSTAESFDGTVVYESSDPSVATVDERTGAVTIVALGTTTISASSEATNNFRAGSASYTLTVAEVLPNLASLTAKTEEGDYAVQLTDALITKIVDTGNYKNGYMQDETAGIYLYTCAAGLQERGSLNGVVIVHYKVYNGLPEITSFRSINGMAMSTGNTVTPEEVTIEQLVGDNADYYISRYVVIKDATVKSAFASKNSTIEQNGFEIVLRDQNSQATLTTTVGANIQVTGHPSIYKINSGTTYQFALWEQDQIVETIPPSDKYYLVGSFNNWTKQEDYKFTTTDGVTYTLADVEFDANTTTFKVIDGVEGDNTTYYGGNTNDENYKIHRDWCTDIETAIPGQNFLIETAGTYTFTFTKQNEGNPQISVTGWPEIDYYLTGDFNTWAASDADYKFTKQNDGTYKLTTNISGNFKVYDSLDHWYGATADGSYWITADNHTDIEMTDDAANYYLETANDYTFIVNPDTKKLTVTGWPIVLDGNAFVKVTSTDELEDGYYLIVYEGDDDHASVAFNGGLETLDGANNGIEVKIAEKLIVANSTTNAAAFIIEKSSDSYTIKSSSNNYIGKTAYSNGLDASETTAYTNTIDFADGNAVITASGNCTLRYNYASDQARFRYYKSGQQPIALYKLTTVEEVPVTIGATGYATLYYSDKALAVPEGVTASTASVADKNITLADTEGFVPAGTGVVLNGEQGEYTFLVVPESTAEPIKDNMLSGSDEAATTTGGGKYYMMSLDKNGENVGFYYGAAKGGAFTNGAHKAYLVVPDATAGAKSFYLFSEAETTGIGSVQSTMFNDGRMEIFNLNGQRVSTPQRGIYIVNGKKVLVK